MSYYSVVGLLNYYLTILFFFYKLCFPDVYGYLVNLVITRENAIRRVLGMEVQVHNVDILVHATIWTTFMKYLQFTLYLLLAT